jgi:outer membrane protein OmpA-like peptidoglycan-associated protein/opacity protein-like surface antigen
MKKLIIFVLLINGLIIANGQNADKKWSIGLLIGKTDYNGDLRPSALDLIKDLQVFKQAKLFGGLSLNRYLNKSFDLGLQATYGKIGYERVATTRLFDGTKIDGNLLLSYKLNNGYIFKTTAFIAPYLAGGIGFANFDNTSGTTTFNPSTKDFTGPPKTYSATEFIYTLGGGLKFNFSSSVALQLQSLYSFTSDKIDLYESNSNDGYFANSVGLIFSFGKPKDTDHDGVPDKSDKCSNTPANVTVDANGCPMDTDHDGIADYLDKCPNVKGLAAFQGCPDTDGDGIEDAKDKCNNTPANVKVDANGCPIDTDGDGVPDYQDKCPKEKGLVALQGCPDADGDGVADNDDRCPNEKGEVALKGCPDKDKDGVADIDDKCPDVPGIKENNGCPEVKIKAKEEPKVVEKVKKEVVLDKNIEPILFAPGVGVIFKGSHKSLNKVVKAMNDNPNAKLQINGHADNVGNPEKNKELSHKRAESAKEYLVKKGINAARMTATGFGDTKPVGDNKTAEGRKQNRRVDFILE